MKRIIVILMVLLSFIFLVSCGLPRSGLPRTSKIVYNKKEIVNEKYGEVDYIIEHIIVYKNLKEQFQNIEGINYIDKNYGSRGSIEPELRENLYIMMDIVKVNNQYKLLVYNNVMKKSADEKKMFVITDYFLPLDMEDIELYTNEYMEGQTLSGYSVEYLKKDNNIKNPFHTTMNDVSLA